jgi:hypothetical protein
MDRTICTMYELLMQEKISVEIAEDQKIRGVTKVNCRWI